MREIELKLAADGGFVVPALADADPAIERMEELPTQNLRAVYYDTDDLRLARHGITLRHRSGEDEPKWTLKFPVDMGAVSVREELNFDGQSSDVPEEAKGLVAAYVRSSGLAPVARLRTRRLRWALLDADGHALAEVVDDEVSVLDNGEVVSRFREIEIEALDCETSLLERLSHALQLAGAVVSEPIPKAVRALGARATAPPDLPAAPKPGPKDPARLAVQSALVRGAKRIVSNDAGVRMEHVEAVHQMRVGARRLRSDLRTFAPFVHDYWTEGLVDELRWIAGLLGNVRDIDVFKESLEELAPDLQDDLKSLYETLDAQHDAARAELVEGLASERYLRLLDLLVAAAREPHLTDKAEASCGEVLPPLVASVWAKLAKGAGKLTEESPAEDFHEVRIKAKRVRYATEAIGPALGDRAEDAKVFAKQLEDLQEVLGDHQDALVAADRVARLVADRPDDARLALAAGRVIERQLVKATKCRESFSKVWGKLDQRKRRKWFET